MKHLRKRLLALLALTLFGGAGAWAQGPTTVFEVDFSSNSPTATTGSMRIGSMVSTTSVMINQSTNTIYTIRLNAAYSYSSKRYVSIKPETGSFQTGDTLLIAVCYTNSGTKTAKADIYAANGTTLLFTTAPGINGQNESGDPVVEKFVLEQDADSLLIGRSGSADIATCITTLKVLRPAADQAIELTKTGANQWTLGQTPDYDLELQVEYYDQYTLDSIPLDWQVKVGNAAPVYPTAYTEGNTTLGHLTITETDSVELIPPADVKPNVKSVTLVDPSAPAGLTLDLATVTEATTVEDGYTVTGTLGANVKISIADGATVTLDGVTINGVDDISYSWAGINCLGDATIILSGTNTVKGFYEEYPGIYVPQNKTLTIQGSGSLTASSSGFGCGIGAGYGIACGNIVIAGGTITATGSQTAAGIGGGTAPCGNISITGGTVTATGGDQAAGIGSGNNGGCGNISITGGTVTANGGATAAGIGSGVSGLCGNISITGGTINATAVFGGAGIGSGEAGQCGTVTITNGVTSVTATKGSYADYSIGAGYGGNCGTVTIGGTTGEITTSPYTYPQN